MARAVFERISDALHALGYETLILPATEETVVEQVIVQLAPEDAAGDVVLQLLFVNDLGGSEDAVPEEEMDFLQFYVHLPFEIETAAIPDMARFL